MKPTPKEKLETLASRTCEDDPLSMGDAQFIEILKHSINIPGVKTALLHTLIGNAKLISPEPNPRLDDLVQYFSACVAHIDFNYSYALGILEKICTDNPLVRQYQYTLAILYSHIGLLDKALFAYKLAVAGESLPELENWMPSYTGSFQDEFNKIDTDPFFHKSLNLLKVGRINDGIHYLREACLCEPDRTEFWAEYSRQLFLLEEWYDCYQALRSLIDKNALDAELYRILLAVLINLGETSQVRSLFDHKHAGFEHTYLYHFAYWNQPDSKRELSMKQAKAATGQTHDTDRRPAFVKQSRPTNQDSDKSVMRIGLLSGPQSALTAKDPFLNFMRLFSRSNIQITLLHTSAYIDPWAQNLLSNFHANRNISNIDNKTLSFLLEREDYAFIIDDGNLLADKRILNTNMSAPCIAFGMLPDEARSMGYSATLLDPILLSEGQTEQFGDDDRCIIPEHSLTFLPALSIDPSRIEAMSANVDRQHILLSLPPAYDETVAESLEHMCQSLPSGWNFVINTAYHGGHPTVEFLLNQMKLSASARKRIGLVYDIHHDQLNVNCQAIIDFYGKPNKSLLIKGVSSCLAPFCLDRSHPRERTSHAYLKLLGLESSIARTMSDLEYMVRTYCLDAAARMAIRSKIAERLEAERHGYKQINSFAKIMQNFLYA